MADPITREQRDRVTRMVEEAHPNGSVNGAMVAEFLDSIPAYEAALRLAEERIKQFCEGDDLEKLSLRDALRSEFITEAGAEADALRRKLEVAREALTSMGPHGGLRRDCLQTYGGGYRTDTGRIAFEHGMRTVCNVVAACVERALREIGEGSDG